MKVERCLEAAQHEAAHLVVGVSLGLRLRCAGVEPAPGPDWTAPGYCWFALQGYTLRKRSALALMYAAGIAWEAGFDRPSLVDAQLCRKLVTSRQDVYALEKAARAMLIGLSPIHARVTRALLDRDLTAADVARLARGERLGD